MKLLAIILALSVVVAPGSDSLPSEASVKKTIATYYGDPGTGRASANSPYATEVKGLLKQLPPLTKDAAIIVDVDDTMLLTYNMEVGAYDFEFDRATKDRWITYAKFPAVPGMVAYLKAASSAGFKIIAVTGRAQKYAAKTRENLKKVGYPSMPLYAKNCTCTTVEFKAGTRKKIEKQGYDIVLNIGDQFSDLQGGFADSTLKLPNPMYFVASKGAKVEKGLTPRTEFTVEPDGSSGLTEGGEGIPNFDLVEKYSD